MRRLILRWLALLAFVAVVATACVLLGRWQLSRLEERQQTNDRLLAREAAEPVPGEDIFGAPVTEAQQWQRVELTGRYDAANQFVIRLRTRASVPGVEIVAPLRTADGTVVLVDRGFLAAPRNAPAPAAPPPPDGEVRVIGFVRVDEQGPAEAIAPVDGQARLVNARGLAGALPYPVADGWVALQSSDPAEPELAPLLLPELSDGPHFWYAVQWFMFGSIGLLGLVVFIRADLRDRRAQRAERARSAAPERQPQPTAGG